MVIMQIVQIKNKIKNIFDKELLIALGLMFIGISVRIIVMLVR